MSVEAVVTGLTCELGEGPHWDESSQCLLFVDILQQELHRWDSLSNKDEKLSFDKPVSFMVPRKKGDYVIGLGQTISRLDWATQTVTVLAEVDQGKQTRLNDGKCDPTGRLWAGTMGQQTVPGQTVPEQGSLFSLGVDGALKGHKDRVTISNGLAWTSDNKTMYYIDTPLRKVLAYDYDINQGTISNERVAVDFGGDDTKSELGFPDGMTIDTEDNIWVACFGGGRVIKFDPRTGIEVRTVLLPAKNVTSCCFGGKDFDELYVTTAWYGLTDEQRKITPLAGSVFKVTGLGVKGRAANVYEG